MRWIRALSRRAEPGKLRLAILSSPRSGNTWLRGLLAIAADAVTHAVHRPADVPWHELPPRFVLQLHWSPEPALLAELNAQQFRIVTLARHPLDLLISILHFSAHERATSCWLDGAGGDESSLCGAAPVDPVFLTYACSPRATALLKISAEWQACSDVLAVRYEDLLRDPATELTKLLQWAGQPLPPDRLARALDVNSFYTLKADSQNHHYWLGQSGHWRKLLPAAVANAIAEAQAPLFQAFGYSCEPDPDLRPDAALAHWKTISAKKSSLPH